MAESQPILAHAAPQDSVEYRDVPGFPGYRVGDDGTIWSKLLNQGRTRRDWKRCNGAPDKDDYLKFVLCNRGIKRHVRIHCLVLEVFRGKAPAGHVGSHDNGNNRDNRLSNLFWKTQKSNIADKDRHGTDQRGERHGSHRLTSADVYAIRERWANGGVTQMQLGREYGVSNITISAIVNGRLWRHLLPKQSNDKAPEVLITNLS